VSAGHDKEAAVSQRTPRSRARAGERDQAPDEPARTEEQPPQAAPEKGEGARLDRGKLEALREKLRRKYHR
jgi:hypothetical protein